MSREAGFSFLTTERMSTMRGLFKNLYRVIGLCPGRLLFLLVIIGLFAVQLARADEPSTGGSLDDARVISADKSTTESVLFYTLRNHTGEQTVEEYYGDLRSTPKSGLCEVTITPHSFKGITSRLPFYVPDSNKKVMTIKEFPEARLWQAFEKAAEVSEHNKVVLFVHGYNIDFLKGCRRAAVFQAALDEHQQLLLFSWPSDGILASYTRDEADIEWSQSYLEAVINRLSEIYGPGRINIVAHSLGSRGVFRALQLISRRDGKGLINELVLLAPDIDADVFRSAFPDLKSIARRITLYSSENDQPLRVSHEVHGYPRLGEAGDDLVVLEGMDTIDVSISGGREVTGHLYHLYNDNVRSDLGMLLSKGTDVSQRPNMKQFSKQGKPYWMLLPVEKE